MKVELLYFDGCPNWKATKRELEAVLAEHGVDGPINLVRVTSNAHAWQLRFVGSPTIRIDERDVEPDVPTEGFNLECRLYWVDGRPEGSPPRDWVATAVKGAMQHA